jgi:1,2-diacylglycerol 3-beta-galactosyltransferase
VQARHGSIQSKNCVVMIRYLSHIKCSLYDILSVDKCFVPSTVLNEKAQSMGLKKTQIVQYGLPIRKGFWSGVGGNSPKLEKSSFFGFLAGKKTPERVVGGKDARRNKLGLDSDLPTVLVVGGGDGMGGIVDIAGALGEKLGKVGVEPSSQMVVVCGSNKDAQSKLASKKFGAGVSVLIQGFVSNMDEWMNASDVIVTKAGPGTIAEASICGLPCMMFAFL